MTDDTTLNDQEQRVVDEIRARMALGRDRYGELDLEDDARDWIGETQEELLDALAYLEMIRVQRVLVEPPLFCGSTQVEQIRPAVSWLRRCIRLAKARGMHRITVVGALQWVLSEEEKR